MLYLSLSAPDLSAWRKKKKKKITNKSVTVGSQWRAGFFQFWAFMSSSVVYFHCSLQNASQAKRGFGNRGMHLNNTRGSVYSPEGPSINPLPAPQQQVLAAQPRAIDFMLPLLSSQNGNSIFNLLTRVYEPVNHNRGKMCQF